MVKYILEARNLTKSFSVPVRAEGFYPRLKSFLSPRYSTVDAVKSIDLAIKPGEKVAFLGPTGAGKSTTIKMFAGILSPTNGSLRVCGLRPQADRDQLTYKIGAVFGQTSKLYYHLTPVDTYKLFWKIYDIPNDRLRTRLDYLVESFEIGGFLRTPVRKLSLGQRMRAEVVASLIHTPEILFLDEPTTGLDMIAKSKLRDVINTINERDGTTILLTSHDIGDIEEVCDRVVIINQWGIVFDGPLKKLKKDFVTEKIISVHFDKLTKFTPQKEMTMIDKDPYRVDFTEPTTRVNFSIPNNKVAIKTTLSHLVETYDIDDISVMEPDTESIIKGFYTGKNS